MSTPAGLSPGSASTGGGGVGSPSMQDRYQRLATEYSKARQQVIVLKTGVLEEQKRSGLLTEELNTARQALRKREEEADSLAFLNRQLQARVDQLQESLGGMRRGLQAPGRGLAGGGSGAVAGDTAVLEEELQRKIAENARLHQDLAAQDEAVRAEAARYRDLLATAEDAAAAAAAARDATATAAAEERRAAAAELAQLEARITAAAKEAETAMAACAELRAESAGLRRDTELLSELLRHSEEAQVARRWSEWARDLSPTLMRMLKALLDLHLHTEQRLRASGSWTETASGRLRACVACLRSLCAELPPGQPELATDGHLLALLHRCGEYADQLDQLAAPLAAAVASEHLSPELQSLNAELCRHLAGDLAGAVRSLADLARRPPAVQSRSQLSDLVTERFAGLAAACQRLGSALSRKSDAEAALRVADEIAAANRACYGAACTLVAKSDHLARQVSERSDLVISRLMFAAGSLAAAAEDGNAAPVVFAALSTSPSPVPPSPVPPPPAVSAASPSAAAAAAAEAAVEALREELQRRTEQAALLESRLSAQQTRIGQLEKERERWMLEAQVMSARLGKQSSPSSNGPAAVDSGGGGGGTAAEIAQLKAAYLEEKCTESDAALQHLESRLMHAQLSAKVANQRLMLALDESARLKDAAFQGREELETTRRNYEEQLAAISDHVTDLNRQLERKDDELNGLRAQFSSTVAKKKR